MIRMYKRPVPRNLPTSLSQTTSTPSTTEWSVWTMEPIARPTPASEETLEAQVDHEAIRLREQEEALEQFKAQVRQEAYAEGLAQGLSEGHAQGLESGHAEGYAAGMGLANETQERAAKQLLALFDSARQEVTDLQEEIGQSLIKMGVRVASHILSVQLANPGLSVEAIVRKVLAQHDEAQGAITFYLHTDDLALVRPQLQDYPYECEIRLIAADDLQRGDVKARTAYGDIDATLETRWNEAMASIGLQVPVPQANTLP
jgi:flagellar assembly protein FliH